MVVSGINDGANIGDDINYSGTVAAAREGYLHGVNSIAISIAIIVLFQFIFPTPITETVQNTDNEILAPAASIDNQKTDVIEIVHAGIGGSPRVVNEN